MGRIKWILIIPFLSGCAGLADGMHKAAGDINHGVARAPDATVRVEK